MQIYDSNELELKRKGGTGAIYRLNDEQVIKVYSKNTTLDDINEIKESIKKLVSKGIPCMISFDVVKVDESYGIVFENMSQKSVAKSIMADKTKLEEYGLKMAHLFKKIHNTEVSDCLPSFKDRILSWVKTMEENGDITSHCAKTMRKLIYSIPDKNTMLHCDFHEGNVKVLNGDLVLIDLDEIAYGNPLYDLAFHYGNHQLASFSKSVCMKSIGLTPNFVRKIGEIETDEYFKDNKINKYKKKMSLIFMMSISLVPARLESEYLDNKMHKLIIKLFTIFFDIYASMVLFFEPNLFEEK